MQDDLRLAELDPLQSSIPCRRQSDRPEFSAGRAFIRISHSVGKDNEGGTFFALPSALSGSPQPDTSWL